MRQFLATTRIAFLDTVKRPFFWIAGLGFIGAGGLAALPFSPGIAAEGEHYMQSGVSTLLLGGVFISLALIPMLLSAGREHHSGEGLLTLPLGRGSFVFGLYSGFGGALFLFFVAGGLVLFFVGTRFSAEGESATPLPSLCWACLISFVAASLILLVSRFLSYIPAVATTIFLLALGQASGFLPRPLSCFLPALDGLDPFIHGSAYPDTRIWAMVHGAAFILTALSLATWIVQKRACR